MAPATRYAAVALEREAANLQSLPDGRKVGAFRAALKIGGLVGAGAIEHDAAEARLIEAATASGVREPVARSAVRRGLRYGEASPRAIGAATRTRPVATTSKTAAPPRPHFPPPEEVRGLWERCDRVFEDDEVRGWIESRGLDVDSVAMEAEVRALSRTSPLPTWARCGMRSWTASGHRALFAVFDGLGRFVSLRARAIGPVPEDGAKSLAPAGFGTRGAVLADSLGQCLLRGESPPEWNRVLVVAEGETDFLSWTTNRSDAVESTFAVFGLVAGAWCPGLAARIPSDATVSIRTDHDKAGERYAKEIGDSLRGSGVRLVRERAETPR